MDATFAHPIWITSGIVMMFVGFVLFRWARGLNATQDVNAATKEVAIKKLIKGGQPGDPTASKKLAASNFRSAMSQLFGIVGFLLMIGGLMAATLGVFYPMSPGG